MTRLVVMWERSRHLSREEAELWAWQQFVPLRASKRVQRLELAHVSPPTSQFGASFEWMVELEVGSVADARALLEEQPLAGVLHELRSLQLRPMVLLARRVYDVGGEG